MIEKDTVNLLLECKRGIEMAISSIDDMKDAVTSDRMKDLLINSRREHESVLVEVDDLLREYHGDKNGASALLKGMSYVKTKLSLAMNSSDHNVAAMMIDGCNMGIKSLSKYLNEYAAASEFSKDVAKKLIAAEDTLAHNLRAYL